MKIKTNRIKKKKKLTQSILFATSLSKKIYYLLHCIDLIYYTKVFIYTILTTVSVAWAFELELDCMPMKLLPETIQSLTMMHQEDHTAINYNVPSKLSLSIILCCFYPNETNPYPNI